MSKCPLCFAELPLDKSLFACLGTCRPVAERDPNLSAYLGTDKQARLFTPLQRVERGQVLCQRCRQKTEEVCPSCHHPLPDGWRDGETLCVALAGPRASGKSNYIAVLVQALRVLAAGMQAAFDHATPESQAFYQDSYYKRLYEELGIMDPTVVMTQIDGPRTPIVLRLKRANGATTFIVLRDVAGEDLERSSDPRYLEFFAQASLIIFLFDPRRVPNIRDIIADRLPAGETGGDPEEVFTHMTRLIGEGRPRLAIAMSKFDVLWEIGEVALSTNSGLVQTEILPQAMSNLGAGFRRDNRSIDIKRVCDDIDLINLEIRSLLAVLNAQNLITLVKNSGLDAQFFALSALGHPPDAKKLNEHGIAPYRILDPILWAMIEEGLLK